MLNAALLGVVDGLDCGAPQIGDSDANRTRIDTPHTLADAIVAYEADTVLCEAMGADLNWRTSHPSRRGRTLEAPATSGRPTRSPPGN